MVARAASIAAELGWRDLGPALEAAFERFAGVDAPSLVEVDRTCAAKLAVATALDELDVYSAPVFTKGIRIVQLEKAFGPPVDTAAPLRARCAAALARSRDPDVMLALVDLLADAEKIARVGAAQALGVIGLRDSIGVLRLKALVGDPEPEVIAECFTSLLAIDREPSLAFVARFLGAKEPTVVESAALALGQSRIPEARAVLAERWRACRDTELQKVLLLAIAVMRVPEATDWLLERIAEGQFPGAHQAIGALAIYREDPAVEGKVRAAVEAAIAGGASESLRKVFESEFLPRV